MVALTFEPHPLAILRPNDAVARLTTPDEKAHLLEQAGADALIVVESTPDLLATRACDFLEHVMERVRPRAFVEGPSFNFGRGREGSIETLREMAAEAKIAVCVHDEVRCEELESHPPINSSAIRAALEAGQVETANTMLGRAHRLTGTVGRGDGRGRGIGFPTANLVRIAQMTPAHGVYAGVAQLEDRSLIPAAINIGPQPTFDQHAARVETHLIDFEDNLRDRRVGLHLMSRLRGQISFPSVAQLVAQLSADVQRVRELNLSVNPLVDPIPLPD